METGTAVVSGAFSYQVIMETVCSRTARLPPSSWEASLGCAVRGRRCEPDAARSAFCMVYSLGVWDHAFLCSFLYSRFLFYFWFILWIYKNYTCYKTQKIHVEESSSFLCVRLPPWRLPLLRLRILFSLEIKFFFYISSTVVFCFCFFKDTWNHIRI